MYRNKFAILILFVIVFSCSQGTQTNKDVATLEGKVYYLSETNEAVPLAGALVSVREFLAQAYSGANGDYHLNVDLTGEEDVVQLTLEASKAGFRSAQVTVTAQKGGTARVPDITLKKMVADTTGQDTTTGDTTAQSGTAAHILVSGTPRHHIYVLGSGLVETTRIDFLVTDSEGIPVDNEHKVLVHFSIIDGPDGGEYLEPDTMTTDKGRVYTVLNSGTVAGPVQLKAFAEVNGQTISTTPIRVAIYGGLPDENHFSVAVDRLNIAGRLFFGILNPVTAFVGDKYSNPVAPGTVVYFSTDYGIVEGSAVTDEMGRATVNFMSAAPLPPNPQDSSFAHITAWTYSDTLLDKQIRTHARVLLSDAIAPIIVDPSSFNYNNTNTPVYFTYHVSDIWGNPLVENTRIRIQATDGQLYGDVDVDLQDAQFPGSGITDFAFSWAPGDSLQAPQVYITIKVTTPSDGNGYQSVSILGTKE